MISRSHKLRRQLENLTMNDTPASTRIFGMPAWIEQLWYARLAFILLGMWTCFLACTLMLGSFHDGMNTIKEHWEEIFGIANLGALFVALPAVLILWRSEVRHSVPLVWLGVLILTPLGAFLGERFNSSGLLLLSPPIGAVVLMFFARSRFPRRTFSA